MSATCTGSRTLASGDPLLKMAQEFKMQFKHLLGFSICRSATLTQALFPVIPQDSKNQHLLNLSYSASASTGASPAMVLFAAHDQQHGHLLLYAPYSKVLMAGHTVSGDCGHSKMFFQPSNKSLGGWCPSLCILTFAACPSTI